VGVASPVSFQTNPLGMIRVLLSTLTEQFPGRGLRLGTPPKPAALFPSSHPAVGDLAVRVTETSFDVQITIGQMFGTSFTSFDPHLDDEERAARVTKETVQFLRELFADRLLFWRAADGRNSGWREFGPSGNREPLVLDNRVYHLYLWSGPLGRWQAIPTILGRRQIQTDREYEIMAAHLNDSTGEHFSPEDRDLAARLVAGYERRP
jgi:hypothetical protein